MRKISIIALALISTASFAQKPINHNIKKVNSAAVPPSQSKFIGKPPTSLDSLHLITLNNVQLKQLSELFQATQQLIKRSPDMSAYQASEAEKSLNDLASVISKQLNPKIDTLRK